MRIPLIRPVVDKQTEARVLEVLRSGHLTEGPITREFEEAVRAFVGCGRALAVTSCTTGLEIALRCLGVGPGDEVIVPDYTYPATASAVNMVGATAVIVDVAPETLLLDYDALEAAVTARTKAAIPVSLFGSPLDWGRLSAIKKQHGLFIVEDAACSLGAEYNEVKIGNQADVSVFSLHPRKFITTGEGGILTTNNAKWADWMLSYKHFGMGVAGSRLTANFDMIGTNSKLSDVLAAIGLAQMDHVETLLSERRKLAANYNALLADETDVIRPINVSGGLHSYQTYCVLVKNRNAIMTAMREQGIEAQIGTYSLHMHRAFADNPLCRFDSTIEGSRKAFEQALALPLFHGMTESEQEEVIEALLRAIKG